MMKKYFIIFVTIYIVIALVAFFVDRTSETSFLVFAGLAFPGIIILFIISKYDLSLSIINIYYFFFSIFIASIIFGFIGMLIYSIIRDIKTGLSKQTIMSGVSEVKANCIEKLSLPIKIIIVVFLVLVGFYSAIQMPKQLEGIGMQDELNACLGYKYLAYERAWNKRCEELGKLSDECVKVLNMSPIDYVFKDGMGGSSQEHTRLAIEFREKTEECSFCDLNENESKDIEENYQQAKDECHRLHPVSNYFDDFLNWFRD